MNTQLLNEVIEGLTKAFSPEWVRAALIAALVSTWVVVAVSAYLGRSTGKNSFSLWTGGWTFYSINLVTLLALQEVPWDNALQMTCLVSAGMSFLFILLGGLQLAEVRYEKWILSGGAIVVVVVGYVGVYLWPLPYWIIGVEFVLLAFAGVYTGLAYWRKRDRATSVLAIGFMVWGVILLVLPLMVLWPATKVIAYIGSAIPTLAVAIGMVVMEESAASEQRYRDVLDTTNTAIFVVDLWTLRILDANRASQRLVKRSLSELGQLQFVDLCPDLQATGDNLLDHRAMFNAVFKPYNEVQFMRPDNSIVLCEGDTHLIQWRNRPALQINLIEVDKERSVGQLVRRTEKLSSLGQLVAGVAHELNNPLAVVMAYAQMMAKHEQTDPKMHAMLQKMLHESERAAKIVRDLLMFARPCQPQMSVVDVNRLVAGVVEVREGDCRAHNIRCEMQLADDLPLTKADSIQIEQVLTNLITNAIHAMTEQEGERKLTVSTETTGFHIRITVADTGPGIPPQIVGRIFDPFFTTKPSGKGTGLGLSISNTIMQEHRGKIWVQSEPGKGAKFFVELLIVPCEPEEATAPSRLEAGGAGDAAVQQRILIVDDEPGIREVLSEILNSDGYLTDAAVSGYEALQKIASAPYDLIISDLCMPGIDGEKLYEKVLEQYPLLAKRIVFVTGDTVSPKTRMFLATTGNRWISKPFNISDVERLVWEMLKPDPLRALTDTTVDRAAASRRYHPQDL